jgi:hypothetical protein
MRETEGTLNLKIAHVKHCLKVLEQRQALSSPYPAYQAYLAEEYFELQKRLTQLTRRRQDILQESSALPIESWGQYEL